MTYSIEKKFYAYTPLLRFYAHLICPCFSIFLIAAIIGECYSGRFPVFSHLVFAALIPLVAFALIALFTCTSDYLYPLTVNTKGLECYDSAGHYRVVTWSQIIAIEAEEKFGMKCLYVSINTSSPVVIPLWLHDLQSFCDMVNQYAGKSNLLASELVKVTSYT